MGLEEGKWFSLFPLAIKFSRTFILEAIKPKAFFKLFAVKSGTLSGNITAEEKRRRKSPSCISKAKEVLKGSVAQ